LSIVNKSKVNYKLGRLEQLKFKMQLQNNTLKLLAGHNEVMNGVYQDERLSKRLSQAENDYSGYS